MAYQQQIERYLEADIGTRSKEWLVPLLYEHLVKHLRRMEIAITRDDAAQQAHAAGKASDILYELLGTLDVDAAPQIAKPLASLYSFLIAELLRIGRARDVKSLQRVTAICADLQDAWTKAAEQVAPRTPHPTLQVV
jgi:flagellar biosynthetic protein FliS